MKITYRKTPAKRLIRMQPKRAKAIMEALEAVAGDPTGSYANLKPLKGLDNGFRLRIGDWRASFILSLEADVMDVFEIEPRGGAYRW